MFSGRVGAGPDQDLASGLGHSVASGSGVAPGSGETPSGGNAHGYVPRDGRRRSLIDMSSGEVVAGPDQDLAPGPDHDGAPGRLCWPGLPWPCSG